jgi:hypothetical protein
MKNKYERVLIILVYITKHGPSKLVLRWISQFDDKNRRHLKKDELFQTGLERLVRPTPTPDQCRTLVRGLLERSLELKLYVLKPIG